jgi:glycosyltransferase involved in cell wall biosynthesis
MWAFSGGCHYDGECERYIEKCGSCPMLGSSKVNDLSRRIWKRKKRAWKDIDLTIVSPSTWLADCAKKSSLLKDRRVEVIHNGIDLNIFKPLQKEQARNILGISQDKKIILFGAMSATSDRRKGFKHLEKALSKLETMDHSQYMLVVVGASEPQNPLQFGFECLYAGRMYDDVTLSLLYSAADVFVAPSVQENLANTVVESLACGTPVVAFDIGGMPDLIEHKNNGYLAKPFEPEDLARGIEWILEDEERKNRISQKAREKAVECFEIKKVAKQYLKLYKEVLDSKV